MAPIANSTLSTLRWGADSTNTPAFESIPREVSGPWVWSGPELEKQTDKWIYRLNDAEIREISDAADAFLASGQELIEISAEEFRLPKLAAKLEEIRKILLDGIGFFLIKGLPVLEWSREKQIAVYMGVLSSFGDRVSQNGKGHVLGHIKSLGLTFDPKTAPSVRIYQTAQRQYFHCDFADLVGLLCLQVAEEGGDSMITSVGQFYNTLRKEYPDEVVKPLFSPFYRDKKGEVSPGDLPYETSTPLSYFNGRIIVQYDRNFIRTAERHEGVPPLTAAQTHALDALDKAAEDNALRMKLEIGDLQLVHNPSLLHDRTAYTDSPSQRRHLLRLWMSTGGLGGWKLPWDPEGTQRPRGGIRVEGVPDKVPLEAE